MKILEFLDENRIISELTSTKKVEVLKELIATLATYEKNIDREELLRVLLEREELGSTGIGDGIAIPHGKLKGIDKIIAVFGRSFKGVDFKSMDGKMAQLLFLLVAPENSAGIHLKALARISRLLKDSTFRKKLIEAKGSTEILEVIRKEDERY
ncbi:MAG: PTS sugar transporter subunit IIA [Thermodesulfobacteriota bacterium]|nr:PTS sugar transporter subunit IIA [Thermodesulfobacteriota bacterium]